MSAAAALVAAAVPAAPAWPQAAEDTSADVAAESAAAPEDAAPGTAADPEEAPPATEGKPVIGRAGPTSVFGPAGGEAAPEDGKTAPDNGKAGPGDGKVTSEGGNAGPRDGKVTSEDGKAGAAAKAGDEPEEDGGPLVLEDAPEGSVLDDQTYGGEDDDFVPSEEIPVDEPIPYPTDI